MSCPNLIVQETNRAYYRDWYDKFVEPKLDIRDGYLHATQEHLNTIARKLNTRPRKTLEFATPAETLNACVASTG